MQRLTICLCLLALSLILFSCAGIQAGRKAVPVRLLLADTFNVPFRVDKCLYDNASGTYYLLEQSRPNLYFYRKGKQINVIGGLGTDKTSFQRLEDIALDHDGNVLALDSFAGLIRKYNPDGKWISDVSLPAFNRPTALCSTPEGDLIIFDSATKELSKVSGFDGKTVFTFGRFQVANVSHLSAGRGNIAAVNEEFNGTVLFTAMGMHLKDAEGQLVLDSFQNRYVLQDGAVRLVGEDVWFPVASTGSDLRIFSAGQIILAVKENTIIKIKPVFQEN